MKPRTEPDRPSGRTARLLRAVLAVLLVFIALIPFAGRIYACWPNLARQAAKARKWSRSMSLARSSHRSSWPSSSPWWRRADRALPALGLRRAGPVQARTETTAAAGVFGAVVLRRLHLAYFLVLPVVFGFLTGIAPEGVAVMTDISRYLISCWCCSWRSASVSRCRWRWSFSCCWAGSASNNCARRARMSSSAPSSSPPSSPRRMSFRS